MNRTKKFIYNSGATALLQIFTMIAGFITPKIMLDFYGSEINGLISSINQFISYFNLVEAGLSAAAVYSLYKPLAENDYKGINAILAAAKKFYTQSGYIFVTLTIGLAVVYPLYINSNIVSTLEIGLLVLILGVNGSLEFFTLAKYRALLTADQKTYVISIASIINIIFNIIIVIVLSNLKVDIVVLRFVALFFIFIRTFILRIYCKRKYKYLNYKEKPNIKALDKRWDALYLQCLQVITLGTPVVIITLVLKDLKFVSVYSIYNMVITGIGGIVGIFISGLAASFGDLISRNEQNLLQKAYSEFEFSYYALITIVYSVTFITIMPFIRIYTAGINDINYNIPVLGFLFVLNGLLNNIKTPQGMLVISAGLYKETKIQTTIQASIIIIFGLVLSPVLGIAGVLVASILANLYRDIDLMFFIPKNVTKTKVLQTFVRVIRIFVCVAITFIPSIFIKYEPNNFMNWFIYAVLVGIYVVIIVFIVNFLFDKYELKNILNRIKNIIKK